LFGDSSVISIKYIKKYQYNNMASKYLSKKSKDKTYNPLFLTIDGDFMDQQQPSQSGEAPPGYTPPQDTYPPTYQRPSSDQLIKSSYPKGRNSLKGLMDPERLTKIMVLGLILMFLGAAIFTVIIVGRAPDRWDEKYDSDHNGNIDTGEYDDYIKDYRGFKFMRTMGLVVGGILLELGLLFLLIALLGGAIVNTSLDNYSRLGMIIAGSIIIALELFFLVQLILLQAIQISP
jgi:hypothetical protein